MTFDEFNRFCRELTATTYVVQWNQSHVWKVGGKVFAIGSTTKNGSPGFSFKASERNVAFLCHVDGYQPAPYFASRGMKWIQQIENSGTLDDDLKYYLTESYRLVYAGLSKRVQAEIAHSAENQ
ncbi:MmcQ/YjbR family DNA-binding protein [Photobacterium damselae]|uniref:MmcQ/YjbR family DNA-binding protein n=1 Tax=Photobacterium damselae TaxID=38293 RepID=UPI001F3A6704|nr:MmcQ/YjbR family DNA-binding protein [Photobacterium damselae]UKA30958.1 MmcQ/YjbR family DNA-binding protein [Photobacterium damselae subsp. damselae]